MKRTVPTLEKLKPSYPLETVDALKYIKSNDIVNGASTPNPEKGVSQ